MVYCPLLPTMGAATPSGVLRALDRFDLISWQGTIYPIARAILAGIAFARTRRSPLTSPSGSSTDLGGDLFLWFLGWRELRRRKLRPASARRCGRRRSPGAWRFAIQVNLTGSITVALGTDRPADRRRPARPGGRGAVPHRLEPRRQRAKARRPARQGLLSRGRADGPHDQEAVEADAARHGIGQRHRRCSSSRSWWSAASR